MKEKLKNALVPHPGNGHIPHILSRKAVLVALALVIIVELAMVTGPMLATRLNIDLAAVIPSVVTLLTNEVRADGGLAGLRENPVLTQAAQAKANDMAEKSYFAHQSPDGSQPWDWIRKAGYQYHYAGENLAVNFSDSDELVQAWQDSPTHNLNLMGPRYTEIGVAVAEGRYKGRRAVFVVQMFASPASTAPATIVGSLPPVSATTSAATGELATINDTESPVLGTATEAVSEVSLVDRVSTSPRTYGTYSLVTLAGFFLLVLIFNWGTHHPRAIMNGALAIAMIAVLIFANKHVVAPGLDLPNDTENSASALTILNYR